MGTAVGLALGTVAETGAARYTSSNVIGIEYVTDCRDHAGSRTGTLLAPKNIRAWLARAARPDVETCVAGTTCSIGSALAAVRKDTAARHAHS